MLGKVGTTYRFYFGVRTPADGTPATGISTGDFTVTVRNPANSASTNPSVTEVSGGMYYFDITGSFTTTNGVGQYGIGIEVDSTSPAVVDYGSAIVDFFSNDIDSAVTAINTRAAPGDAMDLVANAVDAAAIATDAIDADAIAADAIGTSEFSTAAAQKIRDEILADSTPFNGADIGVDVYTVKQNFSYDPIADELTGLVWVELGNDVVATPTSVSVVLYDNTGSSLFTEVDASPDGQGIFKIVRSAPGLSTNSAYYTVSTVTVNAITVSAGKGLSTLG